MALLAPGPLCSLTSPPRKLLLRPPGCGHRHACAGNAGAVEAVRAALEPHIAAAAAGEEQRVRLSALAVAMGKCSGDGWRAADEVLQFKEVVKELLVSG